MKPRHVTIVAPGTNEQGERVYRWTCSCKAASNRDWLTRTAAAVDAYLHQSELGGLAPRAP